MHVLYHWPSCEDISYQDALPITGLKSGPLLEFALNKFCGIYPNDLTHLLCIAQLRFQPHVNIAQSVCIMQIFVILERWKILHTGMAWVKSHAIHVDKDSKLSENDLLRLQNKQLNTGVSFLCHNNIFFFRPLEQVSSHMCTPTQVIGFLLGGGPLCTYPEQSFCKATKWFLWRRQPTTTSWRPDSSRGHGMTKSPEKVYLQSVIGSSYSFPRWPLILFPRYNKKWRYLLTLAAQYLLTQARTRKGKAASNKFLSVVSVFVYSAMEKPNEKAVE